MFNTQRTDTVFLKFISVERKISDTFFEKIVPIMIRDKIFLQREENSRLDTLGIDAVMASKSKIDYVDLKHHAFYFIEERHPDYALELETGWRDSFDKERHCGWFVNPCKVTDVYGFLFWNGTPDHIENMRVLLIRRQDIKDKLKSLGIDVEHWHEYTNAPPKLHNGNHYWFIYENIRIAKSMSLPEQPINLVIPWHYLKDIVIYDKLFCLSDAKAQLAA